MYISIRGKNEILSKKEVRYLLNFYGKMLVGKRILKNIQIQLIFKPMSKYCWGLCGPADDRRFHREFEIIINSNMKRKEQIKTIAHEMVHLKQYALGEFKSIDGRDTYKWMGKKMVISEKNYEKMPWEKEATLSEPYMLDFYSKNLKLCNVSFKKKRR